MACWGKMASLAAGNNNAFRIESSATYDQGFGLRLTGNTILGFDVWQAAAQTTPSVGSLVVGQWHHYAGVSASSTSHTCYRDGIASATSTTAVTPTGVDTLSVGRLTALGGVDYYDGLIGEVAVWNIALSAGQIATLAAGGSPMAVATPPVRYWRFKDDLDFTDLVASAVITNNGSTYSSDNPTVDAPPVAPYVAPTLAVGNYR
jgi:hypothetical protein